MLNDEYRLEHLRGICYNTGYNVFYLALFIRILERGDIGYENK